MAYFRKKPVVVEARPFTVLVYEDVLVEVLEMLCLNGCRVVVARNLDGG